MANIKEAINADLKQAMLDRNKPLTTVLQSLKSAILYKEVEEGKRDEGLDEQDILAVLKKEKKSRQDSLAVYKDAGETERADEESFQIKVIEKYLPASLSEDDTKKIVNDVIAELGLETVEMKDMGAIMKAAKAKNTAIEGGIVSKIIKEKMGA